MDAFDIYAVVIRENIKDKLLEYKQQQNNNDWLSKREKWLVTTAIEECIKIIDREGEPEEE